MSENAKPSTVDLPSFSTARMPTTYANMCRGWTTAEEVILDFALNPNSAGKVVDEPLEVSSRVVLSLPSAARLQQLLYALLSKRQEAVEQALARQKDKEGAAAATPTSPPSE